jgi:hypothetical protein
MEKKIWLFGAISMLVVLSCLCSGCGTSRQLSPHNPTAAKIDSLVSVQDILFRPTKALPMGFNSVDLNYGYSLRVSKDTVDCYLPYYGRAFYAEYGGGDPGIKFISSSFDYKSTKDKKGFSNITINTRDQKREFKLYLSIGSSGYASLNVNDPNKQPITFYGTIDY